MGYEIINRNGVRIGFDVMDDIDRVCRLMNRKVNTFFDVGANVGQTSMRAVRAFPDALVMAFEPTPVTFAALRANTKFLLNVRPFQVAIGAGPGTAALFTYEQSLLNSLLEAAPSSLLASGNAQTIECEVTSLDQFCHEQNIDHISVLKIDTEGFDLPVLQGATDLLANSQIDLIYIEFNDIVAIPGARGGALAPLCEFLAPYDFHFISSYTDFSLIIGEKLFVCANALLARN
jgi:methyltransferase, FkbM family